MCSPAGMPDYAGAFSALIDCRTQADYCTAHIKGAVSIPAAQLHQRMHELPANDHAIALCGDNESLQQASAFLQKKSYRIEQYLVLDAALMQQLAAQQQLESGHTVYRLWQPSPLIAQWPLLAQQWQITPGNGLDIGCGAGRDLVYLAMHGWQMTGVDYLQPALDKATNLAERHGVSVITQAVDVEEPGWQCAQTFDLIVLVRYLHRPLLDKIDQLLNPGGVLLYQTFMDGAQQWGSPKNPNRLLKPGELAAFFSDYQVLQDTVENLPDGRPVCAFIARKPG